MSDKPKHTPGPWWMGEQFHIVYAGNNHVIQCICPEVGGSNVPEAEANARLIATAPELLEALEGMVNAFDCADVYECELNRNRARSVIAKANGEPTDSERFNNHLK